MFNIQSARDTVVAVFDELGVDPNSRISESVLVRNGNLVGRRFQRGGLQIVWFFDAAELKVWGPDGKLVKVFVLPEQHRQAA